MNQSTKFHMQLPSVDEDEEAFQFWRDLMEEPPLDIYPTSTTPLLYDVVEDLSKLNYTHDAPAFMRLRKTFGQHVLVLEDVKNRIQDRTR